MPRVIYSGPVRHRIENAAMLVWFTIRVGWNRLFGRTLDPSWGWRFEVSVLFLRRHMNRTLRFADMRVGREFFDGILLLGDDVPAVSVEPFSGPGVVGTRIVPEAALDGATLLHFHGGGYALYAESSRHTERLIAEAARAVTFALDYRMTPEHPHPAQIDDAVAAYRLLLQRGVDPRRIVVSGDSAGGHLALMLLPALRAAGLPQPALVIAISPWTDVGPRGAGLYGNDRFDLVQGWQTEQFRCWLMNGCDSSVEALSPLHQDLRGLAPIYLQGAGHEILIDMIRDFAEELERQKCEVLLDVWPNMIHEFQGSGSLLPESREALERIGYAFDLIRGGRGLADMPTSPRTERRWVAEQPKN